MIPATDLGSLIRIQITSKECNLAGILPKNNNFLAEYPVLRNILNSPLTPKGLNVHISALK